MFELAVAGITGGKNWLMKGANEALHYEINTVKPVVYLKMSPVVEALTIEYQRKKRRK